MQNIGKVLVSFLINIILALGNVPSGYPQTELGPIGSSQLGERCEGCGGSSCKQVGCIVKDGKAQGKVCPDLAEMLQVEFYLGYKPSADGAQCEPPTVEPTLIKLISFSAAPGEGRVLLTWQTGSEVDTAGYNILRADSPEKPFYRVNGLVIAAMGSVTSGAAYTFIDANVSGGTTYYYRLEDIDTRGLITAHNTVSAMPLMASRLPVSEEAPTPVSVPSSGLSPPASTAKSNKGSAGLRKTPAALESFVYQIATSDGSQLTVARVAPAEREGKDRGQYELDFSAEGEEGAVKLAWLARGLDDGYYLWRSEEEEEGYVQITDFLLPAFDMDRPEEALKFEYADATTRPGVTYRYKLEAVDVLGKSRFLAKASAASLPISTPAESSDIKEEKSGPVAP